MLIFIFFAVGGSLGWKTKGSLDPTFEEVAFSLQPSTTGSPVIGEAKTPFGYHIIMVSLWFLLMFVIVCGVNIGLLRLKVASKRGRRE